MELPKITFAEFDVETMQAEAKKLIEEHLGRPIERADPLRVFVLGLLAIIGQQRLLIDFVAKQNLLSYSSGDYLEHLGALTGVERLPASYATTTCLVKLSAVRGQATIIKKGTRITADNQIYFALDDDVIFSAGEVEKEVSATCTTAGELGNNFAVGELNKIVDPQAFLLSIENITKSEGGADIESDDSLRERIQLSPERFTTAGPVGAYVFHAKSANALISDVAVDSPEPGKVDVYILLKDGVIPEQEILDEVYEKLNADSIRPLTDFLSVKPPQLVEYEIDADYYINKKDATLAAHLISAAQVALEEFVSWQSSRIGLDINPSELIARLKNAGVKRVVVREPQFTVLDNFSVAQVKDVKLNFCGLEES